MIKPTDAAPPAPVAFPAYPHVAPGDQAPARKRGTGETVCPACGGSGRLGGTQLCPNCDGTGKIIVGIGGA